MDVNIKRTRTDDSEQSKSECRGSVRRRIPLKMLGKKFSSKRLLVSSKVWMHTIPTKDCDIVLTLPATTSDATLMWLLARLRSRVPQIAVHFRHHSNLGIYGLYMTAYYESLLQGAEELGICKPLKSDFGGGIKEFVLEDQECFEGVSEKRDFLTSQERQSIVHHMLLNLRATEGEELDNVQFLERQPIVPKLESKNIVSGVFPLHDQDTLMRLRQNWVLSFLQPQPLDEVSEYFGVSVGMYFAYLGHYTKWLVAPAVMGVILWLLQGLSQWWEDVNWVGFSIFNVFWATLYIVNWKRTGASFAYGWGTLDKKDDLLKDSRPLYKGELLKSPITGHLEPYYPDWKRNLFRYCVSTPIVILCLCVVFYVMLLIFQLQEWINRQVAAGDAPGFVRFLPKVLMAIAISFMDEVYKQIAVWLNNKENHRLEETHETNLVIKLVLFQFVNSFLALFYVAFYLRDIDRLRETLAALLITRQILGNMKEVLLPLIKWKFRLYSVGYKIASQMSSGTLDEEMEKVARVYRRSLGGSSQNFTSASTTTAGSSSSTIASEKPSTSTASGIEDTRTNTAKKEERAVAAAAMGSQADSQPQPKDKKGRLGSEREDTTDDSTTLLTQAEVESAMAVYDNAFEDYLEMCIQFGYVTLFSSAFPLAALCALLNNLIEIRSDSFKLCYTHQRPFGVRVQGIGIWQDVLQVFVLIAVIVNSALIGMGDLVDRMVPGMSDAGTIILVVIVEHVILLIKAALDFAIPDMPHEVATQIAKVEYQRREALKRLETQGGSERSPRGSRLPDSPPVASRSADSQPAPTPRRSIHPTPNHSLSSLPLDTRQSIIGHRPHNFNASNSQEERQRGGNPWGPAERGTSNTSRGFFFPDTRANRKLPVKSPSDGQLCNPFESSTQQTFRTSGEAQLVYRKNPESFTSGTPPVGSVSKKAREAGPERSGPSSLKHCQPETLTLYSRMKLPEAEMVSYCRNVTVPYSSLKSETVVSRSSPGGAAVLNREVSPSRSSPGGAAVLNREVSPSHSSTGSAAVLNREVSPSRSSAGGAAVLNRGVSPSRSSTGGAAVLNREVSPSHSFSGGAAVLNREVSPSCSFSGGAAALTKKVSPPSERQVTSQRTDSPQPVSQRTAFSSSPRKISPARESTSPQRQVASAVPEAGPPTELVYEQRETISQRNTVTPERYRHHHQREIVSTLRASNPVLRQASLPCREPSGDAKPGVGRRSSNPVSPTAVGLLAGESSVDGDPVAMETEEADE